MDSGSWALVAVGILGLVGTIYTVTQTRRSSKDSSGIQRDQNSVTNFEANIRAFNLRAKNAEERADAAEKKADDLASRVDVLEEKDSERDRQLNRIRQVVQEWFRELSLSWPATHTMPLPSDEDMTLLGITIERKQKS